MSKKEPPHPREPDTDTDSRPSQRGSLKGDLRFPARDYWQEIRNIVITDIITLSITLNTPDLKRRSGEEEEEEEEQ